VANAQITLPVLLERVDADVARLRDVRVEDFGEEVACQGAPRPSEDAPALDGGRVRRRGAPFGGACGYSAGRTSLTLKTAPSKGVESARRRCERLAGGRRDACAGVGARGARVRAGYA